MFPYRPNFRFPASDTFPHGFSLSPFRERKKKEEVKKSPQRIVPIPFSCLILLFSLFSCIEKHDRKHDLIFSGKKYVATGEIVQIDLKEERVRIAHGDIEGFMEAMTMWFETEEAASRMLKELQRDDKVRFELREATNGPSVIFKIYILH